MDNIKYNTLLKIWNLVKVYGYHVRSHNLDGLQYWNFLKEHLKKNKIKKEWKTEAISRFNIMTSTLNFYEHEDDEFFKGNKFVWELHHFYLQHSRIPYKNADDANFVRLIQIAYNAGQLAVDINNAKYSKIYDDNKKNYYVENKLEHIESYMDENVLIEIENESENLEEIFSEIEKTYYLAKDTQSGGMAYKILKYMYKSNELEHKIKNI